MSRTRTSFTAWVKGMHQAWSRHIIIVSVVAVAFGMLQKPLLALLSFIESLCLAPLSPNWFGAFVVFLVGYLLKREWDYRKIYVPRPVSLWLILLLGIYLYYRHWEGSFSFWPIPYFGKLAWSDLLLIPWGGAVAIALRSRSRGDGSFLVLVLLVLGVVLYFVPQAQGKPSLVWPLLSLRIAVGSCLLGYLILALWGYRLQLEIGPEAQKTPEQRSQAIDPDDAIERVEDDWLGFSPMSWDVHEYLTVLDLSKGSLTVGVIAPWGRGKSSFINLLRKRLERDGGIIIPFNPRGSKSISSIPEDFFDTFAKELSRHYLGFGLLLARYAKHLGLLNQYEWTRPLGSLLTLILPGKEQEAVNRTLRELGKRVYVLLDDLDRLSGEEILEVLKLMDRNASFSNTIFITAYDKAYVNNVLKKHLDHGLAHSFIDKYISWEIPLPEPDKEILERFVEITLPDKIRGDLSATHEQVQEGWSQARDIMMKSLDSVRDLKRYLNLMIPRYKEVSWMLDGGDYFLLYLLCYKDLGVFIALNSKQILRLEDSTNTYMLNPNYTEELKKLSRWQGAKDILERLFSVSLEEEKKEVSPNSLRSRSGFDVYFRGFEITEGTPFHSIPQRIVLSKSIPDDFQSIDSLLEEQGEKAVIDAIRYQVRCPVLGSEDRAMTILAMAYLALVKGLPEDKVATLRADLLEFLSQDRYSKYKELGVIQDLDAYKLLLKPMLNFVVQEDPERVSFIIRRLSQEESLFATRCLYSVEELSKLLSDHQKSKGAQ